MIIYKNILMIEKEYYNKYNNIIMLIGPLLNNYLLEFYTAVYMKIGLYKINVLINNYNL